MIANMTRNLQTNIRKLDKTQMQHNTGRRIHRPSDDPVGITRSLKIRADIKELEQYKKNTEDAVSWLENTEQTVVANHEALKRLRDLMLQGANGVLAQEEMVKIQNEVAEIKSQIISLANSTYSGDYIFSGKKMNQKLLNPDGSYNVDVMQFLDSGIVDHRINYEVGIGEYIPINTIGTSFLEAANLTMTVQLPETDGSDGATKMEFLGAEISLTRESIEEDPDDPSIATDYKYSLEIKIGENVTFRDTIEVVDIDEDGDIDEIAVKDRMYTAIKNIFSFDIDVIKDLNKFEPGPELGISIPSDPTGLTDEDIMDIKGRLSEVWNKLLIEKNIPADINNLTFDTYKNNEQAVGIVAKPTKAGLINLIEKIERNLAEGKHEEVSELLGPLDLFMDQSLVARGETGAKVNRAELTLNRIEDDIINLRALQSKLEDADFGETAIQLMNEENVYRAALQVGARIIQPTLLDFLR